MRTLTKTIGVVGALALLAATFAGCSASGEPGTNSPNIDVGNVAIGLAFPPGLPDVAAVRFEVTDEDGNTQSAVIALQGEGLPAEVDPDLAGHRFADWFVVLNPGVYQVRATPLNADGEPSEQCAPVESEATVFPGVTTEIVLVSECTGEDSGGLDVVVVLNQPPFIEELEFDPSKFVCADEAVLIVATASDPDGDALTYDWQVTGFPPGADATSVVLVANGPMVSFSADVPGQYELTLSVSDGRATAALIFPVYVLDCDGDGAVCGNALLEPGEECDDGNNDDGDGCSADCLDEGDPCQECTEANCRDYFGFDTLADCFEDSSPAGGDPDAGCNPATETCMPNNVLCEAYVECAISSGAAATSEEAPYCGTLDINQCLILGGDGPCVPETEAAAETTAPFDIAERFLDSDFPIGDGARYLRCVRDFCAAECL